MQPPISIAHLTALALSPPELIEMSARVGYDGVGLRLIPVGAENEPRYPVATDRALFERTRAALRATGQQLFDIEVARIATGVDVASYQPAIDAAAELGGRHVLASAWCDDHAYIVDSFSRLCELARPGGLSVDFEYVTFAGVRNLAEAARVVREAGQPNGGLVIDSLHFDRAGDDPAALAKLPRSWFRFVQVCDGPREWSPEREEMIRVARGERLYPGEGGIDNAAIVANLPPVTLSAEIPHSQREAELGSEEHARRCLEAVRRNIAPAVGAA